MPRVASETSALLHPLHNATVRHRALGNGSGDAPSPFALLVDSADAPPTKEPRRSGNRGSEPHPQGSPSSQPTDQSPQTPATADPSAAGASDAAPHVTQASTQSQPADGTEGDASAVAHIDDQTQGDPLDSSTAVAVSTAPQPVPAPPAAAVNVNVSVDGMSAAQSGSAEGDSTAAAAAPASLPAQVASPDTALPGDQATAENQSAAQTASPPAAAGAKEANQAKEAVAAADNTKQPGQQDAATQASSDPASPETGKPADQTASNPQTPTEPQPTGIRPDAPLLATTGKHPAPPADSSAVAARKSDATSDAEDDGGKPSDSAHLAEATADRPTHGGQRTHADGLAVDDKERLPLGTEMRDAAHSDKLPAEAVHAVLLANDQAANAVAQQPASTAGNDGAQSAIPIAGLAVEIAARAQDGQSRFEIRLDPPELGRIDVRLDIDRSGQVTSRLVVDRPETLDQLRRDSAGLERALQDAGLKTAQNGLQFSLRDQGFAGRDYNTPSPNAARLLVPDPDLAPVEIPANAYGRVMRTGSVDIRV